MLHLEEVKSQLCCVNLHSEINNAIMRFKLGKKRLNTSFTWMTHFLATWFDIVCVMQWHSCICGLSVHLYSQNKLQVYGHSTKQMLKHIVLWNVCISENFFIAQLYPYTIFLWNSRTRRVYIKDGWIFWILNSLYVMKHKTREEMEQHAVKGEIASESELH